MSRDRQAGTSTINVQSKLRTAPDISLQCYLVATVIHIQSLRSQICVYIHTLFNLETLVGEKD